MSDDARLARSTAAWDGDAAGAATPLGEAPTVDGRPPGLRVGSTTLADRRYQLHGELGRGGMAVVHRAIDRQLEREVALKLVRPDRVSAGERARLVREARALAKLRHPNVVTVYDVEEHDGQLAIAMALIDGGSLRAGWPRRRARRRRSSRSWRRPGAGWRRRIARAWSTATSSPTTC
jgi:serine/threonine protein kinase